MIELSDNYRVSSDNDNNVILMKKYIKKDGSESFKEGGYYPNLRVAVKDWINKELIATGLEDINVVMDKLDEIEEIVKKIK